MKARSGEIGSSSSIRVLLIFAYLTLNISLNLLNKWMLSLFPGFRFPLLLSISHMLFSFFALGPLMCLKSYRELHAPTLRKQWVGLACIGTFFAVNVGFNNVSLLTVPLSLNQVIRASIPVFAAFGAVFIERKSPTRREFFSLILLVVGVGIAMWEGSATEANTGGLVLCLLGTVSNGLMMSCMGRIMSEKLDALRLTFYTAPMACTVLLPFFWKLEYAGFMRYQAAQAGYNYLGLLILGCMNALAYNVVHALTIKVTSAVTVTVVGEMKIVLILVLSAVLLGEDDIWTFKMLLGCTTAILGFCMYSHSRMAAPAPAPVVKGVPDLAPSLSDPSRMPLLQVVAKAPGGAGSARQGSQ